MKKNQKLAKNYLPFISVVIPAFNEEEYLPLCLKALQKQTYPRSRFEIVVVDNNCTDNTAKIAKKAGARVVIEKNQGHVFALNTGMKKAKGEIIASTDSDTQVTTNWLTTIAEIFQDPKIIGVTGSAYYISRSRIKERIGKISYDIFLKLHYRVGKPSFSGINFAVRKEAFNKVKGLDLRYRIFSDVELGLRLKKIGKVVISRKLLVATSSRRWQKGSLDDYYKYVYSYFKTVWLQKPPKGSLTSHR